MQINIDLLPKPKKVNKAVILLYCLILLSFLSGIYMGHLYLTNKSTFRLIEEQIAERTAVHNKLSQRYAEESTGITKYTYIQLYKELHSFLTKLHIEPTLLYSQLINGFPEQASIERFSYHAADGSIWLQGKFPSKQEIAKYQEYLLHLASLETARVINIETVYREDSTYYLSTIEAVRKRNIGDQHE